MLISLACKNEVKNVENKLLERNISTVGKVTSADELFALFDVNDKANESCEANILLVRATKK